VTEGAEGKDDAAFIVGCRRDAGLAGDRQGGTRFIRTLYPDGQVM